MRSNTFTYVCICMFVCVCVFVMIRSRAAIYLVWTDKKQTFHSSVVWCHTTFNLFLLMSLLSPVCTKEVCSTWQPVVDLPPDQIQWTARAICPNLRPANSALVPHLLRILAAILAPTFFTPHAPIAFNEGLGKLLPWHVLAVFAFSALRVSFTGHSLWADNWNRLGRDDLS